MHVHRRRALGTPLSLAAFGSTHVHTQLASPSSGCGQLSKAGSRISNTLSGQGWASDARVLWLLAYTNQFCSLYHDCVYILKYQMAGGVSHYMVCCAGTSLHLSVRRPMLSHCASRSSRQQHRQPHSCSSTGQKEQQQCSASWP